MKAVNKEVVENNYSKRLTLLQLMALIALLGLLLAWLASFL
jgi:hypothetical protein